MPQLTPTAPTNKIPSNKLSNPALPLKRRAWGPKRRAHQAGIARRTRPWRYATGPRTAAGKAAIGRNALKAGMYAAPIKGLHALLSRQARWRRAVEWSLKTGINLPGLNVEGRAITIQLLRAANAVNLSP